MNHKYDKVYLLVDCRKTLLGHPSFCIAIRHTRAICSKFKIIRNLFVEESFAFAKMDRRLGKTPTLFIYCIFHVLRMSLIWFCVRPVYNYANMVLWCMLSCLNDWGTGWIPVICLIETCLFLHKIQVKILKFMFYNVGVFCTWNRENCVS